MEDMETNTHYYDILRTELVPALGCTEPIAIAYGAAKCREALGTIPEQVTIGLSGNIVKNVKGVTVPNSGGMKGIEASVALGILAGDATAELEVLSSITEEDRKRVKAYLAEDRIAVTLLNGDAKLHITLTMVAEGRVAELEIMHLHTNIVYLAVDNKVLIDGDRTALEETEQQETTTPMSVEGILTFAEGADLQCLEELIGPQIEHNIAICEEGMKNSWGAEVGKTVHDISGSDNPLGIITAITAAGSDARMGGCSLPVIINSGSGNQGITASMPVVYYALDHQMSREQMLRALAVSNLLSIHQKQKIGRLSAYCGVVSAACGAGAAITYLAGGSLQQIEATIRNTLGTVSGMVCDGAKPSCAGKIAVAVYAALVAHQMAMSDRSFSGGDGILKANIEDTVIGVGEMASEGMVDTDRVILDIMLRP